MGFFTRNKEPQDAFYKDINERVRILEHSIESLHIELLELKKKARKKIYQEAFAEKEQTEKNINNDGFDFIRGL